MSVIAFDLSVPVGTRRLHSRLESDAERIAIVGPSGIGKTTLLRAILGLTSATGTLLLRGERFDTRRVEDRGFGWAPQDGALFPHLDVYGNLAFASVEKPLERIAELVGVTALLARPIAGLSGGERQRVAIGRALARAPRLIVLDEPLSALDRDARRAMAAAIEQERARLGAVLLFTSHDESDVAALADEVYVMSEPGSASSCITKRSSQG